MECCAFPVLASVLKCQFGVAVKWGGEGSRAWLGQQRSHFQIFEYMKGGRFISFCDNDTGAVQL